MFCNVSRCKRLASTYNLDSRLATTLLTIQNFTSIVRVIALIGRGRSGRPDIGTILLHKYNFEATETLNRYAVYEVDYEVFQIAST